MSAILSYLLKSIIASGLLYLYYHMALRNKKFHAYNRFYLLASVIISLVVPLINFNWFNIQQPQSSSFNNILVVVNGANTQRHYASYAAPFTLVFAACLSIALLLILGFKIVWIYNVKRRYKNTGMNGFTLIETPVKQAPFSFLANLFWKTGMLMDDENGSKIFKHELVHIKQKHSYDKLFTQIVVCIFWMNPFYWLIQKELSVIHEFTADSSCIDEGDTEAFALMLLQSHNEGRYLTPSHAFFHSSIKRRLIMITTSKKTAYSYARRVLALPVMLCVLTIFSVRVSRAQTDPRLDTTGVKVTKATFIKQGTGDSVVSVKINYINKDGKADTITIHNVHYSPAKNEHLGDSLHVYKNNNNGTMFSVLSEHPSVQNIEADTNHVTVHLKNGTTEVYNVTDEAQAKSFREKYNTNILILQKVNSQPETIQGDDIVVKKERSGNNVLRVYNISKVFGNNTQKVITTTTIQATAQIINELDKTITIGSALP